MQFAPDNQIGKELQQNLIQEIQRRFNKPADDASILLTISST